MNNDDETNESPAIDLGEGPNDNEMAAPTPNQQPTYPTMMLSGGPRLHQMADVGHHTIKAKVIARHSPHGHNKKHRVEIEVHSIKPQMKKGRPAKSVDDGAHIRSLMEGVKD